MVGWTNLRKLRVLKINKQKSLSADSGIIRGGGGLLGLPFKENKKEKRVHIFRNANNYDIKGD